jgi:phosphatidylglycerol:prolipoprotein diacylglycerol transferase
VDSGTAFEVGPIVVHWYGLLVFVGALAGGALATLEARRRGLNPEHVWSGLIWVIIFGFMGARLYHILSNPAVGAGGLDYYIDNPIAILEIWDGGLGIYGALGGGLVGLLFYARRHRLDPWRWLDIAAPGLALAQAIGRWANFINQELYGPPTTLPWGITIDAEHRIPQYADLSRYPTDTTRFHPAFLYESLWTLGAFVVWVWAGRRWARSWRDGDLFLVYLMFYALGRMWIVQFFRADAWRLDNGLAVSTIIAFLIALVAQLVLLRRHQNPWVFERHTT